MMYLCPLYPARKVKEEVVGSLNRGNPCLPDPRATKTVRDSNRDSSDSAQDDHDATTAPVGRP